MYIVYYNQTNFHIKHEFNIPFRISDPEGCNFMLKFIQKPELW